MRLIVAGRLVVLFALAALTAWTVTRSDALADAERALARSNDTVAVQHALDHLERRPWSRDAARIAAQGLSRMGFVDQAEPYYEQAGPLSASEMQDRAFALLRANRREEAIEVYEAILDRVPDDPTALRQLAVVRMLESKLHDAIELARRLSHVPGHEVVGYTMVGSYEHNRTEYEKAVAAFDRVIELDPDLKVMPLPRPVFWQYYAENLLSVGRTETVRRELGRALHSGSDPAVQRSPRLWHLLGQAQQLDGDLTGAEETFRWATRLDPTYQTAWTLLGQTLMSQGRTEEALEPLNRSLDLEPNSWSVVYNLILANSRLGRDEEVAKLRERADQIRRTHGVPTTGMGGPPTTIKTPSP